MIAQVVLVDGAAIVYVDVRFQPSRIALLTVSASQPPVDKEPPAASGIALAAPAPNPLAQDEVRFEFTLAAPDHATLAVLV